MILSMGSLLLSDRFGCGFNLFPLLDEVVEGALDLVASGGHHFHLFEVQVSELFHELHLL